MPLTQPDQRSQPMMTDMTKEQTPATDTSATSPEQPLRPAPNLPEEKEPLPSTGDEAPPSPDSSRQHQLKLPRLVVLRGAALLALLGVSGQAEAAISQDKPPPSQDGATTLEYSPLKQGETTLRFALVSAASGAHVRSSPDTTAPVLTTLSTGQVVQLLRTTGGELVSNNIGTGNQWYEIRFTDSQGQVQTGSSWSGLFEIIQSQDGTEFPASPELLELFIQRLGAANHHQAAFTLSEARALLSELAPVDNLTDAQLLSSLQRAIDQAQPENRTIAQTSEFPVTASLNVNAETGLVTIEFNDPLLTIPLPESEEEQTTQPNDSASPDTTSLNPPLLQQNEDFESINNPAADTTPDQSTVDDTEPPAEPLEVPPEVAEILTPQGLDAAIRLAGNQDASFIITDTNQLWLTLPFDGDNPRYEWNQFQGQWIDHHPGRNSQDLILQRTTFFEEFGEVLVWNTAVGFYQRTTDGLFYPVNTGRRSASEVANLSDFTQSWAEVVPNLQPEAALHSPQMLLVDESGEYDITYNPDHSQDFRIDPMITDFFARNGIERVVIHLTDQLDDIDVKYLRESGDGNVAYMGHSNRFPANRELHVFVYLNRGALEDMRRSPARVARNVEGLLYDALFILATNEEHRPLTRSLLDRNEPNLFRITRENSDPANTADNSIDELTG